MSKMESQAYSLKQETTQEFSKPRAYKSMTSSEAVGSTNNFILQAIKNESCAFDELIGTLKIL
jgi:hypothetical protein